MFMMMIENDNFGFFIIELIRYFSMIWLKLQYGYNMFGCSFL